MTGFAVQGSNSENEAERNFMNPLLRNIDVVIKSLSHSHLICDSSHACNPTYITYYHIFRIPNSDSNIPQ
jgi:hypothetical protein